MLLLVSATFLIATRDACAYTSVGQRHRKWKEHLVHRIAYVRLRAGPIKEQGRPAWPLWYLATPALGYVGATMSVVGTPAPARAGCRPVHTVTGTGTCCRRVVTRRSAAVL